MMIYSGVSCLFWECERPRSIAITKRKKWSRNGSTVEPVEPFSCPQDEKIRYLVQWCASPAILKSKPSSSPHGFASSEIKSKSALLKNRPSQVKSKSKSTSQKKLINIGLKSKSSPSPDWSCTSLTFHGHKIPTQLQDYRSFCACVRGTQVGQRATRSAALLVELCWTYSAP